MVTHKRIPLASREALRVAIVAAMGKAPRKPELHTRAALDCVAVYTGIAAANPLHTHLNDQASSLSGLTNRSEGMAVLRQFLGSFEANSGSIKRKRVQKMAKIGVSAVDQC
jgi:hypothetical protein